ncbi:MAG: hypothetical protein U0840_01520 [Gemmataceae bacterium]
MQGKAFVLLGVNTDAEVAQAQQGVARYKLPWRSWWEGGANGPVSSAWKVEGLPYVVLLDAGGVVRYRGLSGKMLEDKIEELLSRAGH